ncbi:MAG: glycoside hydrolase family 2 protein, partial [Lachnospiraceae bacterium]|nr:glycoside hydrolase family 2 protein [Lachnospiraceae bacterium]
MKRQDFNTGWNYCKEGSGNVIPVTLPHDAMIHDTRDPGSPGTHANAYFPGGIYIYEKTFDVPEEWKGKHVLFEFGGVYKNAKVYLNDKEVGGRPYGYVPFTVCGDGFFKYGAENTIKVVADNSRLPNSRWYSGGGIYRPVSLVVGGKTHIEWEGVHISTLSYQSAQIQVETNANGGEVYVEILDASAEKVVARGKGKNIILDIPNAKLWSEDMPYLYRYRTTLKENNEVVDEASGSFGIRKVEWNKNGLFVNGKETLLRGACIHHDNGVLGACTYAKSEERRIRILKENGYNAIRMSHHPAGRELLDACDKYGMYVMDETFDMWYYHKNKYDYATDFPEWYLKDIGAMVEQDFNHPSVIMYSIGNEVSEPYKPEGVAKAKEMIDFIHGLDRNRAVTAGMNLMIMYMASKGKGIYKEEGGRAREEKKAGKHKKKKEEASGSLFFNLMVSMIGTGMNKQANSDKADQVVSPVLDELDIAGYNYASGRYPLEGTKHPNRIIVGSETFPQDIAKNWAMVKKYPYLIGDFMWTGWDYIGEAAIGSWNYEGVPMQS